MDKSTILRAFNGHFLEFIEDVLRVFPSDTDIIAAKNGLIALKKANPRIILMGWKEYIADRYAAHIERGDIEFFLEKDYTEDIGGVAYADDIMSKIKVLRDPIRSMDDDNKGKVVRYIQNLTKLSVLYVGEGARDSVGCPA
jgi:hypothetical protein